MKNFPTVQSQLQLLEMVYFPKQMQQNTISTVLTCCPESWDYVGTR